MNLALLIQQIREKKSFLCVGLDPDLERIPTHLLLAPHPLFEFNKAIIDATHEYCVAYKPNMAFYEAQGMHGYIALKKTIDYLNEKYPHHFTIADAKRGDIGNTSRMYAKAFLEDLAFDSITVAPYMGVDSVEPFLRVENKFAILLALTSNVGAKDFQFQSFQNLRLFESVLKTSQNWKNADRLMYVVGATQAEYIKMVRNIVPTSFLLVPGVGAQGGSLQEVCEAGLTKDIGLLINSSRSIIYASAEKDFAQAAASEAKKLQLEMANFI